MSGAAGSPSSLTMETLMAGEIAWKTLNLKAESFCLHGRKALDVNAPSELVLIASYIITYKLKQIQHGRGSLVGNKESWPANSITSKYMYKQGLGQFLLLITPNACSPFLAGSLYTSASRLATYIVHT